MIDEDFKQGLLRSLDEILSEESFEVTDTDNEWKDRVYKSDKVRLELSASYGSLSEDQGRSRFYILGLDFKVERAPKDGQSENTYWRDVQGAFSQIRDEISGNGFKIGTFQIWELKNPGAQGKISGIKFYTPVDANPEDVAQAINTMQKVLFDRIASYFESERQPYPRLTAD